MSGIKLDDNGDIDTTNNEVTLTSGLEATEQRLRQRLNLFFQEWFLDRTRGIPYIQQIFVKRPVPAVVDTIFKTEILRDPAVLELQQFELDLDTATRILTLTFRALTDDGPINFEEEFGI